MRTTKELLENLNKFRQPRTQVSPNPQKNRKYVYFVVTSEIIEARNRLKAVLGPLSHAMEFASTERDTVHDKGAEAADLNLCTANFSSHPSAKNAAQFLADVYGYWAGRIEDAESIESYHLSDKTIRCQLADVCFSDPTGLMDFNLKGKRVDTVVTLDKALHQYAKRFLDTLSQITDHGIVPDWAYDDEERALIWDTHLLKANLIRLIVSSCQERKPHPENKTPACAISLTSEEEGLEILVNGQSPPKFNSASTRAMLALALQTKLTSIDTRKFCESYDPNWAKAKSGSKNVPKKFSQAMQSLRRVIARLDHESLGSRKARVSGITFVDPKPSAKDLKKQIGMLTNPKKD